MRLSELGELGLLRELERRGLVPGARLQVVAGTHYESPIEARMDRRAVSVPLGLAREIFVEETAVSGR